MESLRLQIDRLPLTYGFRFVAIPARVKFDLASLLYGVTEPGRQLTHRLPALGVSIAPVTVVEAATAAGVRAKEVDVRFREMRAHALLVGLDAPSAERHGRHLCRDFL